MVTSDFRPEVDRAVSCMRNASGHNIGTVPFIVELTMGQVPSTTKRISSSKICYSECMIALALRAIMKYVSRPKNAGVKDTDTISISSIFLSHKFDIDPSLVTMLSQDVQYSSSNSVSSFSTWRLHVACMYIRRVCTRAARKENPNPNPITLTHTITCLLSKWKCRTCAHTYLCN